MRHMNAGRKFGRNTSHRRAMFRNLAANLITHERIETTDAKAKELRRVAERLLSKAIRLGEIAFTKPAAETSDDPAKAKEARTNQARRLHVERMLRSYIPRFGVKVGEGGQSQRIDLVEKVLVDLAKRFQGRPGGYTRIVKIANRRGDYAPMSVIEFVGPEDNARAAKAARVLKPEESKPEESKAEPVTVEETAK